ncbi:MAG: nucleoside 2-deoxyribosyltransferase [Candidatus Pacebacteria bacterium]|nr:nucleoside 2-deoxyribosyltransferase [Candidatus Paceibacterota bacterium]MBP9851556.1 nucleoside 2-deoxyribosyltransferase [Candidatus Paceibacterota bacterium]
MKIYFAGAIKGGREDVNLYAEIIALLKQHGQVLTEHLGDPTITTAGQQGQGKSASQIFTDDTNWLGEADIVIAEVTQPSLGVGYEIGRAELLDKKICCLFRPNTGKSLSAMISGNPKVSVFEYQTVDQLKPYLHTLFK